MLDSRPRHRRPPPHPRFIRSRKSPTATLKSTRTASVSRLVRRNMPPNMGTKGLDRHRQRRQVAQARSNARPHQCRRIAPRINRQHHRTARPHPIQPPRPTTPLQVSIRLQSQILQLQLKPHRKGAHRLRPHLRHHPHRHRIHFKRPRMETSPYTRTES